MNHNQLNNFKKLKLVIIAKSESDTWDKAKLEWDIADIEEVEESEEYVCGHSPIKEVTILVNSKNNNCLRIGNRCSNHFVHTGQLFNSYKRVKQYPNKSVNIKLLEFARKKNWISQKDYDYYANIIHKRKLSDRQRKWKNDINEKIISNITPPTA